MAESRLTDSTACHLCRAAAADPTANPPLHVVHPETRELQSYNKWGLAVCPTCGAGWYRDRDNHFTFLG
jgi:hypothetical protein